MHLSTVGTQSLNFSRGASASITDKGNLANETGTVERVLIF